MVKKTQIDFPTIPGYNKKTILKVQNELVKMMDITCQILEKHSIPYFVAYGTLIGAIKFEGIIPWDDDVDLFLFKENYDLAMKHLEDELPNHLIVHGIKNDSKYFLGWNKIKNLNSIVETNNIYHDDNKLLKYKCLGIDLYKLNPINIEEWNQFKINEAFLFFKRKLEMKIINSDQFINATKELKYVPLNYSSKKSHFGSVVKMNKPISKKDIFPLSKLKFENIYVNGPKYPLKVLKNSFENIERIPPYEQRITHLKSVTFL